MTVRGRRGNPQAGLPLFPPPLKIAGRFPHSHRHEYDKRRSDPEPERGSTADPIPGLNNGRTAPFGHGSVERLGRTAWPKGLDSARTAGIAQCAEGDFTVSARRNTVFLPSITVRGPWFYCGITVRGPWFYGRITMRGPRFYCGITMRGPRFYCGITMRGPWFYCGITIRGARFYRENTVFHRARTVISP
jgi:hypothetical protein